jgi:hypothetical protein
MNLPIGSSKRLWFLAGIERGIRMSYMSRAYGAGSDLRAELVRQARKANHEMLAYLRAAKEAM